MRTLALRTTLLLAGLFMVVAVHAQCTNNNTAIAGAAISPTCPGTIVVPCVQGGQYALVNVSLGNIYTFNTCTATFDTQLTLFNNTGGVSLGYNDDFCGVQSQIVWVATFTGQLRVLVDLYNCASNTTCAPLSIACAAAPPPLANDDPCGAISLPVNATCIYTASTTAGATATTGPPAPGCANFNGADVWFTVVVPATGSITIDTQTGGITDGGMAIYSAPACTGTFTLIECDDDDSPNGLMPLITRTGLIPGSTLYIRFWPYSGAPTSTFSICATPGPVPPANDDPCAATVLPVNATCVYSTGTTDFATPTTGPPAPTCGNYVGADVWFRFVVPAGGSVLVGSSAGTLTNGAMAAYSATSCAGPFTLLACDDDGGLGTMPFMDLTGLVPGSTIYIRFWANGNLIPGTFNLCVRTPPTGDCIYVLNLFDSFGDGWGSSTVGLRINGGAWTYYTVGTTNNQVIFGVLLNDLVELTYNASGPFQYENNYTLGLAGGSLYFSSGFSPAAGISFQQLVNCQPPPAAPQDCNGGFTLCSAQAFNNNSNSTGNVVDLNPSNQGCLSSGERQGTWYYFSPTSPGNIGFTISPVVATDYDFAVWGPMSTVACPPVGPPLRCSYAAPVGDTGCGNGATDTSEGAGGDRWVSTIPAVPGQIYILYVDNFSSNGQAFNLTWQISGGASLDCTVLAIELVNFDAVPHDLKVNLRWTTLSGTDADHFIVQRSADGVEFMSIAYHSATGNTTSTTEYSTWDGTPHMGINYYRLAMVGTDGGMMHSPVVSTFVMAAANKPFVAPNPASSVLRITMPQGLEGAVALHIVDAAGRVAAIHTITLEDGVNYAELNVERLDPGVYSLGIHRKDGLPIGHTAFVKQ